MSLEEVADDTTIQRPFGDTREYHFVDLSNGMRVMLVSDQLNPSAEIWASMSVGMGSAHTPRCAEGLPHLLEHLTVRQIGKGMAGRTKELHTQYSFHPPDQTIGLTETLVQFRDAIFFPQISEADVAVCVDEIEAEFNLKAEFQRNQMRQLYYETLLDKRHPLCHFFFGNKRSLQGATVAKVLAMHAKFVAPNVAHLAVYSRAPLKEMRQTVVSVFGPLERNLQVLSWNLVVPNLREPSIAAKLRGQDDVSGLAADSAKIPLLGAGVIGRYLVAVPQRIARGESVDPEVSFEFFFDRQEAANRQARPLNFIKEVLQHQGAGSLDYVLTRRGLAKAVLADIDMGNASVDVLQIKVRLTQDTARQEAEKPGSVVKVLAEFVFLYLNCFRKGLYSIDPRPLMNHVERDFLMNDKPITPSVLVWNLATGLREVQNYREALTARILLTGVTPELIKSYWDKLHKDNLSIRLVGEEFARFCSQTEPHHCMPYGVTEMPWQVRLAITKLEGMREGDLSALAKVKGFSGEVVQHTPFDLMMIDFYSSQLLAVNGNPQVEEKASVAFDCCVKARTLSSLTLCHTVSNRISANELLTIINPVLLPTNLGRVYLDAHPSGSTVRVEISMYSVWLQRGGLKSFAIAQVLRRCYETFLRQELYSATSRGFEHSMTTSEDKFQWVFEGPTAGIGHLMDKYAQIIKTNSIPHNVCQQTLQVSRQTLASSVDAMSAEEQALHWLNMIIKRPFYSRWDLRAVIDNLDYDRDIRPLSNNFWGRAATGATFKAGITGFVNDPSVKAPLDLVNTIVGELVNRAEDFASSPSAEFDSPRLQADDGFEFAADSSDFSSEVSSVASSPDTLCSSGRLSSRGSSDSETEGTGGRTSYSMTTTQYHCFNVPFVEDFFLDLRRRQLHDLTMCKPSKSARSRAGAVLVSVQLNAESETNVAAHFTATLAIFEMIVIDLFTQFIQVQFKEVFVPNPRVEVGRSNLRAQLHLVVTASSQARQVIDAVNDFLEALPFQIEDMQNLNKFQKNKEQRILKYFSHPQKRRSFFFHEIPRDMPRFNWPVEYVEFVRSVTRQDILDIAVQAAKAPRIRIVIKHPDDNSIDITTSEPDQISMWKAGRKRGHRTRSLLHGGRFKRGRSDDFIASLDAEKDAEPAVNIQPADEQPDEAQFVCEDLWEHSTDEQRKAPHQDPAISPSLLSQNDRPDGTLVDESQSMYPSD